MNELNMLYEASYKYEDSEGKNISEKAIVSAVNYMDAEKKLVENMPYNNMCITCIKVAKYAEIDKDGSDSPFYRCKISFITLDEKTYKEKKKKVYWLVQADCVDKANDAIVEKMKDSICDYEIGAIQETNITAVIE